MGSSCFSRGNGLNVELIQEYLARNGLDARIEVSGTLCEGMCGDGPILSVDGRVFKGMYPGRIREVLDAEFMQELEIQ